MLVLLPPSETKRDGGTPGSVVDTSALTFPTLGAERQQAMAALVDLSQDADAAALALRLGKALRFEVDRNRELLTSPVMAAMDRYTGVLYDALDAQSLDVGARTYLADHVVISSALFGLTFAGDHIPAYRLSHNSKLPGVRLSAHWREVGSAALALEIERRGDDFVLDLRSEAYVALAPVPATVESRFLRVVAEGDDGVRRALNHFNKKGKGALVRALAESGEVHTTVEQLLDWAARSGIRLTHGAAGELDLVV